MVWVRHGEGCSIGLLVPDSCKCPSPDNRWIAKQDPVDSGAGFTCDPKFLQLNQ